MKKVLAFLLVAFLALTFIGCDTDEDTKPTGVSITEGDFELKVGETKTLTVVVTPSDATDKSVEWSSNSETIATVSNSGKVTAKAAGDAVITVKSKVDATLKDEIKVTVKKEETPTPVLPTEVKVTMEDKKLYVNDTITLSAEVLPANAENKAVEWSSDNESIATITSAGVLTCKGVGSAVITVTCKAASSVKNTITVTVNEKPVGDIDVESITLSAPEKEFGINETVTIAANFAPEEATNKEVTWQSSDTSIATVDANGVVTFLKEGKVTITCTYVKNNAITKTIELTAKEAQEDAKVTGIALTAKKDNVAVESILAITATITPENASDKSLTWTSSDTSIATVDADGVVTGVAVGSVTITATSVADTTIFGTLELQVTEKSDEVLPEALEITGVNEEGYLPNSSIKLTVTMTPETVTNKNVFWTSTDEDVVTVDEDGVFTIVGVGEVTLICSSEADPAVEGSVDIVVYDFEDLETFTPVVGINEDSQTIEIGRTQKVSITVTPAKANPAATYTSSNPEVATVDENGVIKSVSIGTTTVTVTSQVNPALTKDFVITIKAKEEEKKDPESVYISGDNTVYITKKLQLTATVEPATAPQSVVWTTNTPNIIEVNQEGYVTALAIGTGRVKATCTNSTVASRWFQIKVEALPDEQVIPDLGGYEIIIMNADSALTDNDPFLEKYSGADKKYKQQAWTEVENAYNCKIKVVAYPATAPWGKARIAWIIDNATNGTSQCDLGIVSSNWIYQFVDGNAAVDVSSYFGRWGLNQMEVATKEAGSYKGGLYIASTGLSSTSTYVDLGLFYNLKWVEQLGVDDPATMFNEGRWTYSNFKDWVLNVQAQMGEGEFAIGGHPYYYWLGMTNAAGQTVANARTVSVKIDSSKSQDALALMSELYKAGAVDTVGSWAEGGDENAFMKKKGVMTTGFLWFVRNSNRWTEDMWGTKDDTKFGYVPFPYPDSMSKEDTRISVSGLSVYLYVAGRPYPAGVSVQDVWGVMNKMFLKTIEYQESDPTFNAAQIIDNSLSSRIDNKASIEAIRFFTPSKVFFDPAHAIYESISATPLKTPAVNVVFNGADYAEEYGAVFATYENDFKKIYG